MVRTRLPGTGGEVCHGALDCLASVSVELVAVGTGIFLFFFLATVVDLREALSAVDDERGRIRDEADALDAFGERIADLDAAQVPAGATEHGAPTVVETGAGDGLRQVREAYRNTVMSVSHFETEYGEPLPRNMAAEFGDDVAAAVVHGPALTPELKQTLLERGRQARDKRLVLANHLDEEAGALADAADRLRRVADSIDRFEDEPLETYSYDELRAEWYLLSDRREECEQILDDRQRRIQDRRGLADRVAVVDSIEEYIYEPLSVSYPVLATGTDLLDAVERTREQVAATMAARW